MKFERNDKVVLVKSKESCWDNGMELTITEVNIKDNYYFAENVMHSTLLVHDEEIEHAAKYHIDKLLELKKI